MSGYEQRCEGCRFSEYSDRYAGNLSMRCSKLPAATARDNQCEKFEREPGADDEARHTKMLKEKAAALVAAKQAKG